MNKYRAKKTVVDNIVFHSKKEAEHYKVLKMLMKAKDRKNRVVSIECQPKFPIKIKGKKICTYIADFRVVFADGHMEIQDVKGVRIPVYRLKKKLTEALFNITIHEI